jgi:hypothetical protein
MLKHTLHAAIRNIISICGNILQNVQREERMGIQLNEGWNKWKKCPREWLTRLSLGLIKYLNGEGTAGAVMK